MATDYEKDWPRLRIDWAKDKIREWEERFESEQAFVEKRKLQDDIAKMKLALRDWESR